MKSPILNLLIPISFLLIISLISGCKKEEVLSLNATDITLKPNQTFNLVVSPDSDGCVFRSGNENIAEVFASGLIKARLVGETSIVVTNSDKGYYAKCNVTVTPEYTMYREPYLGFGNLKSDIKSYETRQISDENDSTILYTGENPDIDSLMYLITNQLYTSCLCAIPSSQSYLLTNYLAERYVYGGGLPGGIIARSTPDGKTYIVTQNFSSSRIYVYYFPDTPSKNGSGLAFNSELCKIMDDIRNKAKDHYPKK